MFSFRPRISILTVLLLMTILGTTLVIGRLWREVGPLRVENKRLNEERGTLVLGDRSRLHALEIPARFAGECLSSFRIYVPPGQTYVVFLQVNDVPKLGAPQINGKTTDYNSVLGMSKQGVHARLDPGEQVVTVKKVRWGGKSDVRLDVGDPRGSPLGASANIPKDQWPTVAPTPYSVYGGHEERETLIANGSEPLVLRRYRTQGVSPASLNSRWVTPEPDHALDGYILWVERMK